MLGLRACLGEDGRVEPFISLYERLKKGAWPRGVFISSIFYFLLNLPPQKQISSSFRGSGTPFQ